MASSRAQAPPVNLKERIAALQQRNVTPTQSQNTQFANKSPPALGGGLRDKIAKFEQKGGVPVPRGSFGMGAPPPAENAPAKKRGELYGNRIQGLGRPSESRSGSPMPSSDTESSPIPRKRCVSSGAALSEAPLRVALDEPVPPLPSSPPFQTPRRNSLAVNFGAGRRVVSSSGALGRDPEETESPFSSPVPSPSAIDVKPSHDTAQPPSPSTEVSIEGDSGTPIIVTDTQESHALPSAPDVPLTPSHDETERSALDTMSISIPQGENDLEDVIPDPITSSETNVTPVMEASKEEQVSSLPLASIEDIQPTTKDEPVVLDISNASSPSVSPHSSMTPSEFDKGTNFDSPLTPLTPVDDGATAAFVTKRSSSSSTRPAISVVVSPSEESSPISSLKTPKPTASPSADDSETNLKQESQIKRSFTAVVHRKVTETPAATIPASNLIPVTPQVARIKRTARGTVIEPPASPGYGELAALLEEAAMLEMRLTEGNGSTEFRDSGLTPENPSTESQLPKTPTATAFRPELRSDSASTLTSQTRTQSIDSRSLSDRSISIPSIREPAIDGDIPEEDEEGTGAQRSPKSPLPKYLSGFRRLASSSSSRRSSSYMPGAYPRDSISMSSEDSVPVRTPSDSGSDAPGGPGHGVAWPSVSPKKSAMSRSTSFADKLFHRVRTKSNSSTAETDRGSIHESPSRSFTLSISSSASSKRTPVRSPSDASDVPSARPNSWAPPRDSLSRPASLFDKDIFDAFPSVPETVPHPPPHSHLSPDDYSGGGDMGRSATLPVKGRKQVAQRLSMV